MESHDCKQLNQVRNILKQNLADKLIDEANQAQNKKLKLNF
jgi:hypothetical protein